jgi:predicted dehydrogenase
MHLDRRSFLTATTAGLGLTLFGCAATRRPRFVTGRLRYAAIGTGGRGRADLQRIASHPEVDVVALCDVDSAMFEGTDELAPEAARYADWRELFAVEGANLDGISVSTPDHMHAAICAPALAAGLHVYCQKPLTRTVEEARALARFARRSRSITQMGIQNHTNANLTAAHALFQLDLIGKIHEVHVWTDRPAGWWPQGVERPEGEDTIPETLDWNLWLGVAPERPYKAEVYHPFAWRGREDFGTGAQGDMGCHLMDPAVWFLELGAPLRLRSDGPPPNGETYPLWSRVHYEFPPNRLTTRGPLHLTWHDGGKKPPVDLCERLGTDRDSLPGNGCLFVGTDGAMLANPYGPQQLFPAERFEHVEIPTAEGLDHWHQWVDACRGVGEVSAPFSYAAHLTEVALLGNAALRFPHETLEWDARRMRFRGRPEADVHLSGAPREGWAFL